jgi:lipopolysaccharide biosynthesis protein
MSDVGPAGVNVRYLVRGHVRVEHGDPASLSGPRIALFAHWSRHPRTTRSVATLARELQANGYVVVLISACESPHAIEWCEPVDVDRLVVLRKPNVGYDFGSWSVGLAMVPAASTAERTLLLNDSLAGPFTSIAPLLDDFDRSPADVWGLTDTQQFGSHLQSYCLGFRDGVLADRALVRFWGGIRHEADKDRIIHDNELGLSRLLRSEGYVLLPAFPHERVVAPGQNPVIKGWRKLLDLGFPFVKREILRDPSIAPAGRSVPAVLHRRFGIEVSEWVEDRVAS